MNTQTFFIKKLLDATLVIEGLQKPYMKSVRTMLLSKKGKYTELKDNMEEITTYFYQWHTRDFTGTIQTRQKLIRSDEENFKWIEYNHIEDLTELILDSLTDFYFMDSDKSIFSRNPPLRGDYNLSLN